MKVKNILERITLRRILSIFSHIKTRFYVSAFIIVVSIVMTILAMKLAYGVRGYKAAGSEILIPVLGIVLITLILDTCVAKDKAKHEDTCRKFYNNDLKLEEKPNAKIAKRNVG